jgi:hypothetical protein
MEFYLPSLFLILLAAIVAVAFLPRFTPIVLAVFASLCLVLAIYNHASLFTNEYNNMNWANMASMAGLSPYIITTVVILLSIGYIIFLVSSGAAPSLSMPSMAIPPPSTATNIVTRNIGEGLVKSGVANVNRNYRPPDNTAGQKALNSVLAKAA